jgi:hypothetical protein
VSPPLDQDKLVVAVIDKHHAARASCRPRALKEQVSSLDQNSNGDRVRLRADGRAMDFAVVLAILLLGRHFAQRTFIYFQF